MGLFDFLKRSQGTGAMDAPAAEPERAVIEGRIPDDLRRVRTVWEEDSRADDGEGHLESLDLYADDRSGRSFLYYSVYAFSTQFVAGALPGTRRRFGLTAGEAALDDGALLELARTVLGFGSMSCQE